MSECSYHPGKDAVGACVNCGRMVCITCRTELHDKIYCQPCANKLFVLRSDLQPAKLETAPADMVASATPVATVPTSANPSTNANVESIKPVSAVAATQHVSSAWWLLVILPILFGGWNFIGGIIAWAVNKNKDPKKARSMLIWGIVLSVLYVILVIVIAVLFAVGFLVMEGT